MMTTTTARAASFVAARGIGQMAYLVVYEDEVVCYGATNRAFRPKPTGEVLARVARTNVRSAGVKDGVLEIMFADGPAWQFDVARLHLRTAGAVAAALAAE